MSIHPQPSLSEEKQMAETQPGVACLEERPARPEKQAKQTKRSANNTPNELNSKTDSEI
jgi:hypothetical protein